MHQRKRVSWNLQHWRLRAVLTLVLLVAISAVSSGCGSLRGQKLEINQGPSYPYEMQILETVEVELFRDGPTIELVNNTAERFRDFNLWINERYMHPVESLPPGESIRLSLRKFVDEYGEKFRAGGLLSTYRPDPIVKAEFETGQGLVGIVTIPEHKR